MLISAILGTGRLISLCRSDHPAQPVGILLQTECVNGGAVAPLRGRGSKHDIGLIASANSSRPFAGAWIETVSKTIPPTRLRSPLCGGVDRNFIIGWYTGSRRSRPFAGAWIET